MRQGLIVLIILFSTRLMNAQIVEDSIIHIQAQTVEDSIIHLQEQTVEDSIVHLQEQDLPLEMDTTVFSTDHPALQNDTLPPDSVRIKAYRLTDKLGDSYRTPLDTSQLNFSGHSLMDGHGLAVAYLANIGSPAQSRIFIERDEDHDFIFRNGYNYYITTPKNATFYDVKDPYTRLTYLKAGGDKNGEEIFNGLLTSNFGKKLNVGLDFDYTYSRGHYASNNNKLLYYRPFVSYIADRYEARVFFGNYNYINSENGGMTNDRYVTHPDDFGGGKVSLDPKNFPTRFINTWNRIRGQEIFLTHRYNLGFYRELTEKEAENAAKRKEDKKKRDEILKRQEVEEEKLSSKPSDPLNPTPKSETEESALVIGGGDVPQPETNESDEFNAVFVPVSSIIHTLNYSSNSRRFISNSGIIDTCYQNLYANPDSVLNDYTEMWSMKNTVALSMREGFQDWIKFGLTAFVNFENRKFTLPGDSVVGTVGYDEFATFIGAELYKTKGKLFTFNARGELCVVGTDLGEFNLTGELKSQFKLLGKDASIKANGFIKNQRPAFYLNHNHSRYFWWDNSFKYLQKMYVGGEVNVESTKTTISAGVESIQNFIYFGTNGMPEQYNSNLQVITAKLRQNFRYKALGWDNEIACQLSSNTDVLPLPQICAYTNLYLDFNLVKVLRLQLGADAHYFTSYSAPYYEPATQQFQNQNELKIGNYPIINAYA
ncbi:MAG: putative porin, partial [Tannerella sp.]|nr:putative porin [Tannerella sp.]